MRVGDARSEETVNVREAVETLFTSDQAARLEEIQQRLDVLQARSREVLDTAREWTYSHRGMENDPEQQQRTEELEALGREALQIKEEGELLVQRKKLVDQVNEVLPTAEVALEALNVLPELLKGPTHGVVGGFLTVLEDLGEESVRFAELRARGLKNLRDALLTAEFSRDEAMDIILASIGQDRTTTRQLMAAARRR